MRVVLDTHAAIWFLLKDQSLPPTVASVIRDAASAGQPALISAITLVEIVYLAERGRIVSDAYENFVSELESARPAFEVIPVSAAIVEALRSIPRAAVPDMPDRIIAATALHLAVPLVTADRRIQSCGIPTIW